MPEPAPTRPPPSSLATASLVLGVLSIVLIASPLALFRSRGAGLLLGTLTEVLFLVAPLLATLAIICGHLARRRAESAPRSAVVLQGARAGQIMGIIGIVVWTAFVFFLVIPALAAVREEARRINCGSNLKAIGCVCLMYADDYRGAFPPDFRVLVELKYCDAFKVYACPSAKRQPATTLAEFVSRGQGDYAYFGTGLNRETVKSPERTVLMADKAGNHDGHWNVVFVDDHVAGVRAKRGTGFEAAARQNGWIIPGTAP